MKQDKIKITYEGKMAKSETVTDCPWGEYIIPKKRLGKKGVGRQYCTHPFIERETIKCNYGLNEIRTPKECPLRENNLVQKVELIT